MIGTIGESLVDIVNGKERIGGSPYNVALAASRLGAPVTFFGKISADEHGRRLLERMIDNGVLFDPQMCNAPEPTLCSKTVLDKEGKASYEFTVSLSGEFVLESAVALDINNGVWGLSERGTIKISDASTVA